MTQQDMYNALLKGYGYNSSGCHPSTRYNEKYRKSRETYNTACEIYDEEIRKMIEREYSMNFNDTKFLVDGQAYIARDIELTENYGEFPKLTASAYLSPSNRTSATSSGCTCKTNKTPTIEKVIFSPPVTVVLWSDKTKTIVRCDHDYESFDPEKGLAMAIAKKLMGDNKSKYYDTFKYWRKKWDEQNKVEPAVTPVNTSAGEALAKLATDICNTLNDRLK